MVSKIVNGNNVGDLNNAFDYYGAEEDHIAVIVTGGPIYTFAADDVVDAIRITGGNQHTYLGYGNDAYYGGAGIETVRDGDGNDYVELGESIDIIKVGAGNDVFVGGGGEDTVDFSALSYNGIGLTFANVTPVVFDLARTSAQNLGVFGVDRFSGFENVIGGSGNDRLFGTTGANEMSGFSGNDLLNGRAGSDKLVAGVGSDVVIGGRGRDFLYATDGFGSDTLRDRFVYRSVAESGPTQATRDQIYDFRHANLAAGDRIDLHRIDANPSKPGNQAFVFGTSFHAALHGEVVAVNSGVHSLVYIDIDRDAAAEMTILVRNVQNLKAFDFIL